MIGSDLFPSMRINELVFNGGTGNSCSLVIGSGLSCSSDQRLKTDIHDLPTDTLSAINQLRTVTFKWVSGSDTESDHIGFIAQNVRDLFPELVTENKDGLLAVNYANFAPILAEGIKELDLKIQNINTIATAQGMSQPGLIAWFANIANGITDFFAETLHAQHEICIDDVCVTKTDFQNLLNQRINDGVGGGFGYGHGN